MLDDHLKYFSFITACYLKRKLRLSESHVLKVSVCLHAAELEAVSISLVMGGKVVVVENPDAENGRVNARTQEEDCDKARHLVEKKKRTI